MCQHYIVKEQSTVKYDPKQTKRIKIAIILKSIKHEIEAEFEAARQMADTNPNRAADYSHYLAKELAALKSLLDRARQEMSKGGNYETT